MRRDRCLWTPRALACAGLLLFALARAGAQTDNLRVLIVGGGPNPRANQVAIESNVRYLLRLLPATAMRTVLFADGDARHDTVAFEEPAKELPAEERLVTLLLQGPEAATPSRLKFRAPSLAQMDGPSMAGNIATAFARLSSAKPDAAQPLLLYFTGHGSPAKDRNLDNNVFDLWDGALSVRDLARHIAALPPEQPLAVVMVQCFSGAFGNLLFEGGDPRGAPVERDIAGFFATVKERVAAGCTSAVDESEYHDFSSYFFAALTGRDRVGRPVRGADYNGDGRVGMDEAYCYTLINDESVDIPVCTSDVLLRRVVQTPDTEIFQTPYSRVRAWATPAQRAALEGLSKSLKLLGEERSRVAYERFTGGGDPEAAKQLAAVRRAFQKAYEEARGALLARWPDLRDPKGAGFAAARAEAVRAVRGDLKAGKYRDLLAAESAMEQAEEADFAREIAEARLARFVRLFKSVVLAHAVRDGGDETAKRRLARLTAAESRTLLPPADRVRAAEAIR